jgi:hypothetical protein
MGFGNKPVRYLAFPERLADVWIDKTLVRISLKLRLIGRINKKLTMTFDAICFGA